jgi:hypothetical protein
METRPLSRIGRFNVERHAKELQTKKPDDIKLKHINYLIDAGIIPARLECPVKGCKVKRPLLQATWSQYEDRYVYYCEQHNLKT